MKVGTRFYIFSAILLVFVVWVDLVRAEWPEVDKLVASDGADSDYFGRSVSVSGDYAIVGAHWDDDNGSESGSAYIFKREGEVWSEEAKLVASDGASGDQFGYCVSISGDYAIVGAPFDDDAGSNRGSAYIFRRSDVADDPNWYEQDKLVASDGADDDEFGWSVSISGDYAIVGAHNDDESAFNSGTAYIFKRVGEVWSEEDKLFASDGAFFDLFGSSVSISGDCAIVGSPFDDDDGDSSGSAYIFERGGSVWSQQSKLTSSDGAADDIFGWSVCISGDIAIIGAYGDGLNSGSAYVFEREGGAWSEEDKLTASDGATDDEFGWSVSVSGDYAIAGARGDGSNSGSAYIFKREGSAWSEEDTLLASAGAVDNEFGFSVCMSGDYAIIGVPYDNGSGLDFGSAYIFGRCPDSDSTGDCFVDFRDLSVMGNEWLKGHK